MISIPYLILFLALWIGHGHRETSLRPTMGMPSSPAPPPEQEVKPSMSTKARAKALSQEANLGFREFAAYNFKVCPEGDTAYISPLIIS